MKLFAGGVRGSTVVADPAFARFGGDTTCFLIEGAGGERIIVDAGSGLRGVAARLGREPVLFLMTHYHMDHVLGFSSFPHFYAPGRRVEIAAPPVGPCGPGHVIPRLFEPPLWPLQVADFRSPPLFTTLPAVPAQRRAGGIAYRWCPVHHAGHCFAYRFDEEQTGRALVIATDLEWALATEAEREAFLLFCRTPRPPDLLLVDGHYTPEDYGPFRGWGHSRWSDGVEIAERTGAGKLCVIHHAPANNDERLVHIETELRQRAANASLLRQGNELSV